MDEYTLILPQVPQTVNFYDYNGNIEETVEITKIETSGEYVHFTVKRTYHEDGTNYSAMGKFGWKVYDSDGVVVDSGTAYTDGTIKVGEASKGSFSIDELGRWRSYRLEILHLS